MSNTYKGAAIDVKSVSMPFMDPTGLPALVVNDTACVVNAFAGNGGVVPPALTANHEWGTIGTRMAIVSAIYQVVVALLDTTTYEPKFYEHGNGSVCPS